MTEDTTRTQLAQQAGVQKSQGGTSPTANPRSCVTCRRRKVKCDKQRPCSNCVRGKIECIFPGPGRAPRKSRKTHDGELLERLRRLEGVVQTLNAQVEEHEHEAAKFAERAHKESDTTNARNWCATATDPVTRSDATAGGSVEELENRFGRLVVDQGRSRYVNNNFWASLNKEVEDLKSILIEPSDDEQETYDSPRSSLSQHPSFMFGYSSSAVDMLSLHPSPEKVLEYWTIYKENVDPLVKVLHLPSFEPTVLDAFTHLDRVPKGLECFLFTIYYGAVTSLSNEDCIQRWGEERDALLARYRFGLEQGLARANFLYADEMIILQAFLVFLTLLRRNDDARKIYTLSGLMVRIAQTLGIHRDGSHFNLSPFEAEMRRRLWWQICVLDARSSEDHGADPSIVPAQFDTKMPLNINDADLDPDMTEYPEERVGFTDMTFSLIRFEVTSILRNILYVPPAPNKCTEYFANLTIPEKEKWISDCHQRLEDKYLKNCDMSIPLFWVTATISRLVMSKMWLIVYHPQQRKDGGASLPQETKDKLFITSLENLEYSILLETEARTMKWGWLFRTYVQWHAIAFLLSELCVRTRGEAVERAWRAVESSSSQWLLPLSDEDCPRKGRQGRLWKPLRKLMHKARQARERAIAQDLASANMHNGNLDYSAFPTLLNHTPASSAESSQPDPENVDRMLRPTAPRLGEIPIAKPPSWAGSPVVPDWATAENNGVDLEERNPFVRASYAAVSGAMQDSMPGQTLLNNASASHSGPSYLQGMTDIGSFDGLGAFAQQPQAQPPTTLYSAADLHAAGPAFAADTVLPDAMPSDESPDAAPNIDWTEWDEQVKEFVGMEGMQSSAFFPPANATYVGGANWF